MSTRRNRTFQVRDGSGVRTPRCDSARHAIHHYLLLIGPTIPATRADAERIIAANGAVILGAAAPRRHPAPSWAPVSDKAETNALAALYR